MSSTHVDKALKLREHNLAFLRGHYPYLYAVANHDDFQRLTLHIDQLTGMMDLHDANGSLYQGDAHQYAEEELNSYLSEFHKGALIGTIPPPQRGPVGYHRFFSKRLNRLVNSVPKSVTFSYKYPLPDFYPLMVFMGCGLGIHIEQMLSRIDVQNVIIFEPEPEFFMASLYVTDWQKVLTKVHNEGRSINIVFTDNEALETSHAGTVLWNELINYCPSFPVASLFYNHQRTHKYDRTIAHVRGDMHYYLNQWGYYDDEVNQFNNAFHNVSKGIPQLSVERIPTGNIAIVVGGGPSLDDRIEEIWSNRDKVTIISCGTAVHSLVKKGIRPHIHVEIESHMLTFEHLKAIDMPEFFTETLLIGAVQLPPNVFDLFEHRAVFYKDSTAMAELFPAKDEVISYATPTCTNTGAAIAAKLGFSTVLLYGMDFGFHDIEKHHSKSSIYFTDDLSENIRKEIDQTFTDAIEIESVFGKKMYSIPMYCTSKKTMENCILAHRNQDIDFHNCSNGARIKGTYHLTTEQATGILDSGKHPVAIDTIKGQVVSDDIIKEKNLEIRKSYRRITKEILAFLGSINSKEIKSLFLVSHQINRHMLEKQQVKYGRIFFTIRGSVWHFLHAGASISLLIQDAVLREQFIDDWKNALRDFLRESPDHLDLILGKQYPDASDPWIRDDIVGNEEKYQE